MPIYDFMADLSQLRENYESYDDKRKKQFDNLKDTIVPQLDYSNNKDINTINETDNVDNVPEAKTKQKGIGMLEDIFNINTEKNNTNTSVVSLSDDQLNDSSSGWSDPQVAADFEMGNKTSESGILTSILGESGGGMNQYKSTVDFGMDLFKNSQQEAGSVEESAMNTFSTTMKGAQAGMELGGPWGAAIGGTVGLTAGLMDLTKDKNSRHKKYKSDYNDMLEAGKTKREEEQAMKDGEESLAKLTALRKAQLGYIS